MAQFNFWNYGTSNNSSTGFSGLSSMLSDYASIKNGSYGKLMKSYYNIKNDTSVSGTGSGSKTTLEKILEQRQNPAVSKEVSNANAALSQGISDLSSSVRTLQKDSTYEAAAAGQSDQDKVVSAVKNFVNDYNDVVSSAKKSTNASLTSNVASMMKSTTENKNALAEIGVTVNRDGTVSLNEKKLKSADSSKVQELFSADNKNSYGSVISAKAIGSGNYTSTVKQTDSTQTKQDTNTSALGLKDDAKKLSSSELFTKSKATDASGNETEQYDVSKIMDTAKSFVDNYNKMLTAAKSSKNSGVISNLNSIQTKTKDNETALKEIGINRNTDGSLSLNEETFKNSDMSQVQKTFKNYGSSVSVNASLVNHYMQTQADATNGYASNGTYNTAAAAASYNTTM